MLLLLLLFWYPGLIKFSQHNSSPATVKSYPPFAGYMLALISCYVISPFLPPLIFFFFLPVALSFIDMVCIFCFFWFILIDYFPSVSIFHVSLLSLIAAFRSYMFYTFSYWYGSPNYGFELFIPSFFAKIHTTLYQIYKIFKIEVYLKLLLKLSLNIKKYKNFI